MRRDVALVRRGALAALVALALVAPAPAAAPLPVWDQGWLHPGLWTTGSPAGHVSFYSPRCQFTGTYGPSPGAFATGTVSQGCLAGCTFVLTPGQIDFTTCGVVWPAVYNDANPTTHFQALVS